MFAVGPNPASRTAASTGFFVTGKSFVIGKLTFYAVAGNVIRKIDIRDAGVTQSGARRQVGSWDMKDAKGRPVSEGTYLVRGVITTAGGTVFIAAKPTVRGCRWSLVFCKKQRGRQFRFGRK